MENQAITLSNNFHGTTVNLHVTGNRLSPSQMRRARRTLCGYHDCTCSGYLGTRGPQAVEVDRDGWIVEVE